MPVWAASGVFRQSLDPLGIPWLSTVLAALPVVALFVLLVPMRWLAPKAALGGAVVALVVAILPFGMPWDKAFAALGFGMAFGLLPIGWNILFAMFLYNVTVETGQFTIIRRSVASVSPDARVQAILIGFCFGAFLEGAAGGGTPVAICGAILVGLGFRPFQAAVLCLIANTSPVAFGGLGAPLLVLGGVTDLPTHKLSEMAAAQLPIFSCIVPIWMVKCMATWRQTWEVLPALVVAGLSFAGCQFFFATAHRWIGIELFNMTDIAGGMVSLIVTAAFMRFWQPRSVMCYTPEAGLASRPDLAWAEHTALTPMRVLTAWMPYLIMSVALFGAGLLREVENRQEPQKTLRILGPLETKYILPIPALHDSVYRDTRLHLKGKAETPESASYEFAWATSAGTSVLFAAIVSMAILRMNRAQTWAVIKKTVWQMRIPIPTIALMLGLSYVTRFSGMDACLGYAFAGTGVLYPFFGPILGWLGVFLTGTDAGSNALFGSLQKIGATEVYQHHLGLFTPLDLTQAQMLICTGNSTGGVMGKMIDAQSICVATAATHQIGREADIFKAVVGHSIGLASLMGLLVLLQAYVWPFQAMVPAMATGQ